MKDLEKFENIDAYELVNSSKLDEVNSTGLVFRHKKTKARVVVLSNDDDNKVFSIGFRTPPKDSTGVAHIIEHSVLCGSKKYPAKDPFVELAKGSLNTFLNAITYPDKTVYPIASCNDKDFQNLMSVYLDAVFYPNIYERKEIFMQEGWHYELESLDSDIEYNGVVYNEMKGAFSSPEQILYRNIQHELFPDVAYGVESGGDPKDIPNLTYENFLDFHRKYYHPSNSYIYLYGDMDVKEKLEWIDKEYLSNFDYLKVDSEIKKQKAFDKVTNKEILYPISENEDVKDKTYHSYNTVIGTSLEKELCYAFEVLDYVLISSSGAPLKKAILDSGIAKDVFGGYDADIYQPMFSIIAKDSNVSDKEKFVDIIMDTLKKVVKDGVDKKALLAAINRFEFKHKENDSDRYPKGLIWGLDMFNSWLYDDNKPFMRFSLNETYKYLKDQIGTRFYENLIEKYLINNTHASLVSIVAKPGLTSENDKLLKEELKSYKDSLSKEQLEELIETTKKLKEYQIEPSTKEELDTLPMLERCDIKKEALFYDIEYIKVDDNDIAYYNTFTNGIGYTNFIFKISDLPKEFLQYVELFTTALGYFDTKNYTYSMLDNEMNIKTGGISFNFTTLQKDKDYNYDYILNVAVKNLDENVKDAYELVKEMIYRADYSDYKHLKEIIMETSSRLRMRIISSGHVVAARRATSYYSKKTMFDELTAGIEYLSFLVDLEENFEEKKEEIVDIFNKLTDFVFCKERLITQLVVSEKSFDLYKTNVNNFIKELKAASEFEKMPIKALEDLNVKSNCVQNGEFVLEKKNEAFKTASKVQYVSRAGEFHSKGLEYTGALNVLKIMLSYDYLWVKVRVQGGAYGCMCSFARNGQAFFTSYRDPNLAETNDVYDKVLEYIHDFDADEKTMTKYIIGAISSMDTPLTAYSKGCRAFEYNYANYTKEDFQKERDQVLNVTKEDIKNLEKYVKAVLEQNNLCVIGNENKIIDNKDMFISIKELNI